MGIFKTADKAFQDPWLHVEPADCQPFPEQLSLPMSIAWGRDTVVAALQDQLQDAVIDALTLKMGRKWEWQDGQLYLHLVWEDTVGVGEGFLLARPSVDDGEPSILVDARVCGYLTKKTPGVAN